MTWNHDPDRQSRERFERRARRRQRLRVDLRRHDEAEPVAPQRVAGNQHAVLRVEEAQCAHVVARRCDRIPIRGCPSDTSRPRAAISSDAEALRRLIGVVEQQRLLVPRLDQRHFALRNRDRTAVGTRDRRIAAHVIAVTVRVDDLRERRRAERRRAAQQRQREGRVPHVAGVDEHRAIAAAQQDVVRGQPVADEHLNFGGKGSAIE